MLSIFLGDLEHDLFSVVTDLGPQADHEVRVRVSTIVPREELHVYEVVERLNRAVLAEAPRHLHEGADGVLAKEIIERY